MEGVSTRRDFLKAAGMLPLGITAGLRGSAWASANRAGTNGTLKGFIVSDAHFGWRGEDQPSPDEQREMMRRILSRFEDLDVFIDTGDAHHNYAADSDKGDWTEVIANGCGHVPFYYVSGNHELEAWGYDHDPEWTACRLGSVACRPYYSFDIKNVHFVSLPQMINMSLISDEEIEWLKLDLDLNRDKTTIILSHNSLKGTTEYFGDLGYRVTANSEVLLKLFSRYPNVVGWLHGHNHSFEVVAKEGTVYVSNGRIGGFIPGGPGYYGAGHLGGIYFEVGHKSFKVMCYSASAEKFLHEIEHHEHLSHELKTVTSLDLSAGPNFSYGYGGARDGQRIPAYNHYAGGSGTREIFITGSDSPFINNDPGLSFYTQRTGETWQTKHLGGYQLEPLEENEVKADETWHWVAPGGILLHARNDKNATKTLSCPLTSAGLRAYYRCPAGRKYRVRMEADGGYKPVKVQFVCFVADRGRKRYETLSSDIMEINEKGGIFEHVFDVPDMNDIESIYTNSESDNLLQIYTGARFSHIVDDVFIKRYEFMFADGKGDTLDAGVLVDGMGKTVPGKLKMGQVRSWQLATHTPARSLHEVKAAGNGKLTWIVRQTNLMWQVRNGAAEQMDGYFRVGPLLNTFSPLEEIVIVPMQSYDKPFVHRMRHVYSADVHPLKNDVIIIDVMDAKKDASIEIARLSRRPVKVEGARSFSYEKGRLNIKTAGAGKISIIV